MRHGRPKRVALAAGIGRVVCGHGSVRRGAGGAGAAGCARLALGVQAMKHVSPVLDPFVCSLAASCGRIVALRRFNRRCTLTHRQSRCTMNTRASATAQTRAATRAPVIVSARRGGPGGGAANSAPRSGRVIGVCIVPSHLKRHKTCSERERHHDRSDGDGGAHTMEANSPSLKSSPASSCSSCGACTSGACLHAASVSRQTRWPARVGPRVPWRT